MLSVAAATPAQAQEHQAPGKAARDQVYVFPDDPLDAVGHSERGARLRLRQTAGRTTLIRPRTHFIVELTQSVENL
jgi:hypothetical protein